MFRYFSLLILFNWSLPAAAQTIIPRQVVSNVAEQIESHYYDENAAKQIGQKLRKKLDSGAYDDYKEPLSLAFSLTETLKPYDAHFRVNFVVEKADGKTSLLYGFGERVKRSGYGIKSVSILPANIGYINMNFFAHIDFQDQDDPAKLAIDAALSLTSVTDALIIDLRQNGGGSPHMVGYLSSAFVHSDANIYNQFKTRSESFSEAPEKKFDKPYVEKPLYILISGGTASAAEAFSYTMQAAKRATIVGEPSYGAANPGREFNAGNGFSVFVSNGSPTNPITKANWEGDGVQPDIVVDPDEALLAAQLALLSTLAATLDPEYRNDVQWVQEGLTASTEETIGTELAKFVGSYGPYEIIMQKNILQLVRGQRPKIMLIPVAPDLFFNKIDPQARYQFVRNDESEIIAVEFLYSDGSKSRVDRN